MQDRSMVDRRPSAESPRITREHLELALEGAALGTWDWNIATGETVYNDRWAQILGLELDEVEAHMKSWEKLIHPDDYPKVLQLVDDHLKGKTPVYQAEYRLRHRDGRWIWILAHGRVYEWSADGRPVRAAGIHQDITQRKEAEEALLLSREAYKNTVELTTQIPWIADPDGAVVSCDPVWKAFTGRPLKDALGNAWLDSIHPHDQQSIFERWLHSISSGEPYRATHRLRRFDGEFRYVESRAQPQRNADGRILRWYGTTEDIHERTLAEQSLRASDARLALALEGARLSTWDWDIRSGEVIRSAPWFAMLGYEEDQNTRQTAFWIEKVHPEDWPVLHRRWEAHCAGATATYSGEFRIRHQSGEWRWILSHGQIVERDENGPVRACGINQDITERRQAEEALANSERFSRLLLEAYQDCVVLLDQQGHLLYVNPAGVDRLGISAPDGVQRRQWMDLWHPDDHPSVRHALRSAFAGQQAAFQASSIPHETPPVWWDVLLSPVDHGGQQKRVLAVAREITRLKAQEEKQRDIVERERMRAILENLNEGIIIAAPDGAVLLMNRAAQEMYGFDSAADQPIHCRDLFAVVDAADASTAVLSATERPLARAVRGEVFSGVETLLRNRRTGKKWIASCGSTPVHSPAGELLLAVLSVRDVTADRSSADEIRHANQVLHELSGRLLRLQDDERKRIALELHDGTVQVLSAALMNLTVLSDSPRVRGAEFEERLVLKTLKLAQQGVQELRTMSYLLHPPVLDELGLAPALRSWIDGFSERTGIPVDIAIPDTMGRLAPEVERALFRITQEGLGNVHRHAESTAAAVRLAVSEENIKLEIEDDGKGFDRIEPGETLKSGVGLLGMRERASQLGGSLVIDSRAGRTVIGVSLPRRANGA